LDLIKALFYLLSLNDAVLLNFLRQDLHQRDHRLFLILKDVQQLPDARCFRINQIVSQHHGKGFVANQIARAQNRVAQSQRLFLPNRYHLDHFLDPPEHFDQFCLSSLSQDLLQFGGLIEVIFDAVLAASGDEDNFLDSRVNRLLYDVLN
jgi:hypothetical protein